MTCGTRTVTIAVLLCIWSCTSAQNPEDGCCTSFGYANDQASEWGQCCSACAGCSQTPINVDTEDVETENLPTLEGPFYNERNTPFNFSMSNDNFTVTIMLKNSSELYIEGGPLDGRYYLEHVQFCWGSDDTKGSEHTIDGKRYPLESQFGLFSERYGSYEEASNHTGGVLRVAHVYPIVDEENPSLAPIVSALPNVVEPGQVVTPEEPMTYDHLFSGFAVDEFYAYNGSFPTPPCSENVIWIIYPVGNGVSKDQVEMFRTLNSTDGPLVNNFRPIQPLNGRRVVQSEKSCRATGRSDKGCRADAQSRVARRRGAAVNQGRSASRRHGAARHHH